MSEQDSPYACGNCGAEFPEPTPVYGRDASSGEGSVVRHECPQCGEPFSERFTRERNIENCVHNATQDVHGGRDGVYEICQECGAKFGLHGERLGIKEAWATPSSMEV